MAEATGVRNSVIVPQLAWHGDIDAELVFPDGWEITECTWPGATAPKISNQDFRRAMANPIQAPPLRELARGKKNVVIVFDDMSRPTKVHDIVPFVLEELHAAGVDDNDIQFICGLGCHGALNSMDFRLKLGDDVVARYNVYNHNIFANCTYIGTTSYGTPVSLNTEFVNADLTIGIGCIVPHPNAGFGGGAKIVLPGVASIESIKGNHAKVRDQATGKRDPNVGYGKVENNPLRQEMDEICRMSGLDFIVDVIVNQKRDAVAVFAGKPVDQYYEGVKMAREHYRSVHAHNPEVVVVNAYAKHNEAFIGVSGGYHHLPESGGTLVLISNNLCSDVTHYLSGGFGNHMGGPNHRPAANPGRRIKKLIVLSPYLHRAGVAEAVPPESIIWVKTWEEVIAILQADYPQGAKVAVVPDVTIQYFP